jgi:hypothetical protein
MSNLSKRRLSTSIIPPIEFNAIQRKATLGIDQSARRSINTAAYDILEAAGLDYQMTIQDENEDTNDSQESINATEANPPNHKTLNVDALLQRRKSLFEITIDASDIENLKRVPSSRKQSIDLFTKRNSIGNRRNSVLADPISSSRNSVLDASSRKNSVDVLSVKKPKKRVVLTPAQKQEMREGTQNA